jgi:outer membrane protein TolC
MISLVSGVCLLLAGAQGGAPAMTLDDAIKVATKNAFSLKIAGSNVEKLRQQVNEAKGTLGPQLVATGNFTRYEAAINASMFGEVVPIEPLQTSSAVFTLSFPIDLMGNIGRGVKAANLELKASRDTYEAQLSDLKLSVRQSFFQVLQAQELVKVSQDALVSATERLDNVKKQFDVGTVAKVDVMQFETAASQAESNLIAAKNGLDLAKSAFNNALGRPIETEVDLVGSAEMPSQDRTTEDLVQVAVQGRPEMHALLNQVSALRYVREAQERGLQPSLGVEFVETQNFQAGFGATKEEFVSAAVLTVPIFDSGVTRARVKEARQDEVAAKTQYDELKLGISLEVRQALTNLTNAKSRYEVAKHQVEFAAESYRLAKLREDAGEGISLEVIDAQTADTQAKAALVTATYDYLTAYSQLQRALGTDDVANAKAPIAKEKKK